MTYDTYHLIFQVSGIAAIVMLILTVVLFFVLKVPKLVGDLSGRIARKGIESIRAQNVQSGDKRHMTSAVNRERGTVTDKISPSGQIIPKNTIVTGVMTEKINVQEEPGNDTVVLTETQETEVLTDIPFAGETSRLNNLFQIEYEICFIHTDEKIN